MAFHPEAARVGLRLLLADEPLVLGRKGSAFGAGVLDDETLSRRHLAFTRVPGGVEVEDLDSRNGTFVNGESVKKHLARHGDSVSAGQLVLLLVCGGRVMERVHAELERVAPLGTTVLLVGETGSAKSHLARWLHAKSGRDPIAVVRCAGREAISAERGTLLLEGIDDAPAPLQTALVDLLDRGAVRVIATARTASPASLRPELLSRLSQFIVRVPPLRERVDEIPALARDLLARKGRWLKRPLLQALLRHRFPWNVRELESLLDRAVLDAGDAPLVDLSPGVAEHLGARDEAPTSTFAAAADGSWFRPPGAARVSLVRRENLARLLRVLVTAHRDRPGQASSVEDLFTAGWPGEKIQARSAAGRVYVALNTLRNLGLRDLLQRDRSGYRLDEKTAVEVHG